MLVHIQKQVVLMVKMHFQIYQSQLLLFFCNPVIIKAGTLAAGVFPAYQMTL